MLIVILTSLLHCNVLGCRSDHVAGRSEEAAYLSGLKTLWRGFIHMHAVAKLVTKSFAVSGIMDNLNEVRQTKTNPLTRTCRQGFTLFLFPQQDLPDSIQVGGRISPQIVWDYLEKIRATGTKVGSNKAWKVLKCKHPQFHMFHSD